MQQALAQAAGEQEKLQGQLRQVWEEQGCDMSEEERGIGL
jgi:hypothetical protein